jgi:hypothetical protein
MRHARFAIALGILIAVPAFADTAPTTPLQYHDSPLPR